MKFVHKIHIHDKNLCRKKLGKGTFYARVISKKPPWWYKNYRFFQRILMILSYLCRYKSANLHSWRTDNYWVFQPNFGCLCIVLKAAGPSERWAKTRKFLSWALRKVVLNNHPIHLNCLLNILFPLLNQIAYHQKAQVMDLG